VVLFFPLARSSELVVTRAAVAVALSALQGTRLVAFIYRRLCRGHVEPDRCRHAKYTGQMTTVSRGGTLLSSAPKGLWLAAGSRRWANRDPCFGDQQRCSVASMDVLSLTYAPDGGPKRRRSGQARAEDGSDIGGCKSHGSLEWV